MSAFRGLQGALRQLRIEGGMTQEDLAKAAGVGRAAVQAYESGRSRPRLSTLELLLDALGVGLGDLAEQLREEPMGSRGARPRLSRKGFLPRTPSRSEPACEQFHGFLASLADLMQERRDSR